MSEVFDSWNVQVLILGTWIDLSPDVRLPLRVSGLGIMANGPLDKVGNDAQMTFSLDNSITNTAGVQGYYSPGKAGGLTGWTTGLFVRLFFAYDGIYKGAYYGRIIFDGIKVEPFTTSGQSVNVTCSNWMHEAANQTIDLIGYETNKRADEGIGLVITNAPNKPLATSYQVGLSTFPSIFDVSNRKTKIVSEINKLTTSELGYTYIRGDHNNGAYIGGETLVFENRTYRYGQRTSVNSIPLHSSESVNLLLLENGDNVLLEDGSGRILLEASQDAIFTESDYGELQTKWGKHLYNRARLTSYPRKIDAAATSVLWNLENPILIAPGEIKNGLRAAYRDPNGKSTSVSGISMVTPVSGTDYKAFANSDGTGTNYTANLSVTAVYGTAEVEYTLQNTGANSFYVTTLQARGKGVYVYDSASVLYESNVSIVDFGVSEIAIDLPYVSNATQLFNFSNSIDKILLENLDNLITEDGKYIYGDDEAGVFDLFVSDSPSTYIDRLTLVANRNKFNMLAFMTLDAGSFIKISETLNGIDSSFSWVINGYDFELEPGGIVKWHPVLLSTLECPKV